MSRDASSRIATAPADGRGRAPRRWRWARPVTALVSVAATLVVLELVVRSSGAPAAPAQLRDGLYVSQLPLLTGRETTQGQLGAALPTAKRPGEIRVFVFGESSVQGLPWGYGASPVAMLRDQLHALAPAQDLTVVNMGRSASAAMDAYYHLASIAPYAPDFVVFYQGSNDFFDGDAERCAPLLHPELHRAWRWVVERSRLFWAARALGPRLRGGPGRAGGQQAAPVFGRDAQPGDRCDAAQAFAAWTDILVMTAQRLGARVIVTTPVENPLCWPDEITSSAPVEGEPYRRLLACVLTDGCDVVATWKAVRDTPDFTWDRLRPRRRAWADTAAARGARLVDFADHVARDADEGLRPPLFVEEVHLSMEGYWRLSWLWTTHATLRPEPPQRERFRHLRLEFHRQGLNPVDHEAPRGGAEQRRQRGRSLDLEDARVHVEQPLDLGLDEDHEIRLVQPPERRVGGDLRSEVVHRQAEVHHLDLPARERGFEVAAQHLGEGLAVVDAEPEDRRGAIDLDAKHPGLAGDLRELGAAKSAGVGGVSIGVPRAGDGVDVEPGEELAHLALSTIVVRER